MPSAYEGPASQKVLYVEDEPVNALLMRALFERVSDCELVVAENGARALELARGLHPALLLLDLRLPDIHGSKLLPMLRRLDGCAGVPAVAVTAEHCFDHVACGFDELWRKPLNLLSVLDRVEGYLALAQAQHHVALPQHAQPPIAGSRWRQPLAQH